MYECNTFAPIYDVYIYISFHFSYFSLSLVLSYWIFRLIGMEVIVISVSITDLVSTAGWTGIDLVIVASLSPVLDSVSFYYPADMWAYK